MGQSESKSKIKGSFTFAYLNSNNNSSTSITKKQKNYDGYYNYNQDSLLNHPELYGLRSQYQFLPLLQSPSLPSTSMTSLDSTVTVTYRKPHERPDSGYMSPSYDGSMQLANDLEYIDNTYYTSLASECFSPAESVGDTINSEINIGTYESGGGHVISFADVMLASPDKTLHEVYLSYRSIYRLSPNIAMLTMIRKLDL
jgi:hypothetical protein